MCQRELMGKQDIIDLEFVLSIFMFASYFCFYSSSVYSYCIFNGIQYRMPEAYDQDGGVNQEKRFSVALQRYRSVDFMKCTR